jgi:hypothetical protein
MTNGQQKTNERDEQPAFDQQARVVVRKTRIVGNDARRLDTTFPACAQAKSESFLRPAPPRLICVIPAKAGMALGFYAF